MTEIRSFGEHHNLDELSKEFLMVLARAELQKDKSQVKLFEMVDNLGLTKSEFLMIKFLKNKNKILVKELAIQLDLTNSTIVERLNSLEEVGMIKRERSSSDRRRVKISLTEKSKKIVSQIDMDIFDFIPDFFVELTPSEKSELLRLFKKVNRNPNFPEETFQKEFSKRIKKLIGF